jgi:insulysin
LECFKKYLSPASTERARLSVYLYAQGKGKDGEQDETKQTPAPAEAPDVSANGKTAIDEAIEIEDVYAFKASLAATPGARPVKDLSEYEDTDAKL